MIVALAGGVGAARFLDGLARIVDPRELYIIGNVADDAEIHGLHISPDLDTVMYTLAGIANRRQGWGRERETFHCLEALAQLGADAWFRLGDRDLATHLYRTQRLRAGATLAEVTSELASALQVKSKIVPATNDSLRTIVKTQSGDLEFQDYFVRRRARDRVQALRFEGARRSRPAAGILENIASAKAVILCPSNPFISIGPILAVPGIREALRKTRAPVVAISPIVGGKALKGPAARMMKSMGHRASADQVAALYRDFLDVFVLDQVDANQANKVEAHGIRPVVTDTIMTGIPQRKSLATAVVWQALFACQPARNQGRAMTFALLPVKSRVNAKQRLADSLTAAERAALARVMYEEVLDKLTKARGIDRIVVVTNDESAAQHASRAGVEVFHEHYQQSHSHSADRAALQAMEQGAETVLLLPIDVPLVTTAEIEELAAAARPGVIIVPSADGTGTNALVRTPPDVIESRFGKDSFRAHVDQARAKGIAAEVMRPPGIVFDIDTPEDIAQLLASAPNSRTAALLRKQRPQWALQS